MSFWTVESIKSIVGGTWLARPETQSGGGLEGVSTDTRTLTPGQMFVALRGENFDGNRFVIQAAAAGAALAIVDRPESLPRPVPSSMPILHVPDSGAALLRLGGAYRKTLDGTRVIAVTGSNGKTTTTRLCHAVLSRNLRGTVSPKSFNNRVGVPLTILSAKRGDQFLICEVGTNAVGEIAELAEAISPDIAVVTSIGREHLEGLKSLEGSVSEAVSLVNALRPGGLAVINADAPLVGEAVAALKGGGHRNPWNVLSFGLSGSADLRITSVEPGPEGVRFCVNDRNWFQTPLLGRHNALNAAAAVGVARRLGIDHAVIESALAAARGPEMRLERRTIAGVEVINDAYNANPESMLAAIDTFAESFGAARKGRRVAVLGDMLELGDAGPDAHREIADAIAEKGCFDLVVLAGPLFAHGVERLRKVLPKERVVSVPDMDGPSLERIVGCLAPGDVVLLKASRGMGLERVVRALAARAGPAAVAGRPGTSHVGAR